MKLVALNKLSKEQASIIRNYLKISGEEGLLVGAVSSKDLWNTKPLIMRNGSLVLLRFLDGMLADSRKHREAFQSYFSRLKSLGFSAQSKDSYTWFTRSFCQTVLTSEEVQQFDSIKKRRIISDLVQIISRNFKDEIIHGNICLSNIATDGDTPYLLDYCCAAFSPSLFESFETLAPEIKTGSIATQASDIYGLGTLISSWLGSDLLMQEKQLLQQMLEANPFKRPKIEEIVACFEVKKKKNEEPEKNIKTYSSAIKSESIQQEEIRPRQPTTRIILDPDSTLESKLEWLKGTANLDRDLVEQIKANLQESLNDTKIIKIPDVPQIETRSTKVTAYDPIKYEPPKSEAPKYEIQKVEKEVANVKKQDLSPANNSSNSPKTAPTSSRSLSQFLLIVLAFFTVSIISTWLIKREAPTKIEVNSNFKELWQTGISSRMADVAKVAVQGNAEAEFLIVKDVLAGSSKPNVNIDLIKFAYHPEWEQTLTEADRKLILSVALSSLTLEKPVVDQQAKYSPITYVSMSNFSPELQLPAIEMKEFSMIPGKLGEDFLTLVSAGVTDIKSSVFKSYIGIIFSKDLATNLNNFFKSSNQTQAIAKLLVLRNLAVFTQQPELVLGSFLSTNVTQSFSKWFKDNPTVDWTPIPSSIKLDLLSRKFPNYEFKHSQLIDLIFFPLNSVAIEAKSRLLAKSGLFNSEIYDVLMDSKAGLLRSQVSLLVTAFELKGDKHDSVLSKWFDTNPVPQTVMRLLVACDQQTGFDVFSLEAARYLSRTENKSWQASPLQLETMSRNNEELVRALSVLKLDPQIPEYREILVKMETREPNERIRNQIRSKLGL